MTFDILGNTAQLFLFLTTRFIFFQMYFYVLGPSQECCNSIVSQIFYVIVVHGDTFGSLFITPYRLKSQLAPKQKEDIDLLVCMCLSARRSACVCCGGGKAKKNNAI